MPIYEYRCADCGFQKEYLQKLSDPVLSDCPTCGKASFNKMLSAAGFQLKGSGWYATDFKNSGGKKSAPASGEKTVSKSESAAPTGESKSESTTSAHSCGAGACSTCS